MFHVTYELVTPESAEVGDFAEVGYVHSNGGRDAIDLVKSADDYAMTLRDALRHCSPSEDCGTWLASDPETIDYRTGTDMATSLHPPRGITPASYRRLKRLLNVR